ncbi:hypothetical protein ACIBL6_23295 [Streptomyces sp. NPDC050400]|uniref:hypothetical protein n=1 Tax=Streptomyces sp. NPDC050400 TaxID=3365610 RepID=UPI00378FBA35
MEPYDTASTADPFAASTSFFSTLVDLLTAPESGRLAHHDLEELLNVQGRLLLRLAP